MKLYRQFRGAEPNPMPCFATGGIEIIISLYTGKGCAVAQLPSYKISIPFQFIDIPIMLYINNRHITSEKRSDFKLRWT